MEGVEVSALLVSSWGAFFCHAYEWVLHLCGAMTDHILKNRNMP